MVIDEAGGDDQAAGVDGAGGALTQPADLGNLAVLHAHVGAIARQA